MTTRPTCITCGRRFQAAAALPVPVSAIKTIGGYVVREWRWETGCPECFTYDEQLQEAVPRQAVTP